MALVNRLIFPVLRFHGTSNMATLADDVPAPRATCCEPFVLASLRAWTVSGTGQADLELYQKIYSERNETFNRLRRTFPNFGTGTNAFMSFRIAPDDEHEWVLDAHDAWVPVWTNPDDGTMHWYLEIQLATISETLERRPIGGTR